MSVLTDGGWRPHTGGMFDPSKVYLYPIPLTAHNCPVTEAGRPLLTQVSCHHLRPRRSGTEVVGCPKQVQAPEHSQPYQPGLLGFKYDTPLTHVSLHTTSHGSTQPSICQVQTHPWAEGLWTSFYGPSVVGGCGLGPLGLAPTHYPLPSTLLVRPQMGPDCEM